MDPFRVPLPRETAGKTTRRSCRHPAVSVYFHDLLGVGFMYFVHGDRKGRNGGIGTDIHPLLLLFSPLLLRFDLFTSEFMFKYLYKVEERCASL